MEPYNQPVVIDNVSEKINAFSPLNDIYKRKLQEVRYIWK